MRVRTPKSQSVPLELVIEEVEQGRTQSELTSAVRPTKAQLGWKAAIGALGGFAILAFAALTIQQQPGISQTISRRSDNDYSLVETFPVCAQEGGDCTCGGQSGISVAFGANGKYSFHASMNSSVACTNEVFGDPIFGVEKTCRCMPSAFTRETNLVLKQTWVHCANEGERCTCPHSGKQRFGGDGVFVEYGDHNSPRSRQCDAVLFVGGANYWGPDVAKTCQCLEEEAEEVQRPLTIQEYAAWHTFYSDRNLDCPDATPGPGLPQSCACKASYCSYQGTCSILESGWDFANLDCNCVSGRSGSQCQVPDLFGF